LKPNCGRFGGAKEGKPKIYEGPGLGRPGEDAIIPRSREGRPFWAKKRKEIEERLTE